LKSGNISIPANSVVCVIYPGDGQFDGVTYESSGEKVGQIVLKSIPKKYNPVVVSSKKSCESNYFLATEILEYEDRATGWSGKPDRVKVKLTGTNSKNDELSTFTYDADTNVAASAFLEWGNSAPYKLLGSKFTKQVANLLSSK